MAFCPTCGEERPASGGPACQKCGAYFRTGPDLLVLAGVVAEDRVLLIQRGLEPYRGSWSPPGGFVEANESVEAAAAREVLEETGVQVAPDKFVVTGVASLTNLNQVHITMFAILDAVSEARAHPPETLDAKWCSEDELQTLDIWPPSRNLDRGRVFRAARSGRLGFVHFTDGRRREFGGQE